MDWFYLEMRLCHLILAWASVLLFAVRSTAFQLDAKWASDSRLSVLAFFVDTLLTITGLSLWVLLHFNPMRDTWLLAKFFALAGYTFCAHWSMWRGEFTLFAYLGALLWLSYMMAASFTRSASLGLF